MEVDGYAQRLLGGFIHFAVEYPHRVAGAMWYVEDAFVYGAKLLKKAFDEALADERRCSYRLAKLR